MGPAFCIFTQTGGQWFVFLIPVFAGLLVPLLQIPALTGFIERLEAKVADRRSGAQARPGKFARFVSRPFYACAAGIWSLSDGISDPHIRAGARVVLSLYFVTAFLFLLFIAAEIIIGLVIVVAMLWLVLWVISHSDELSRGEIPRRTRPERLTSSDVHGNKIGESVEVEGVFGHYTKHLYAHGNEIYESRVETGIFGDKKEGFSDRAGNEIGVNREDTGILGDEKTVSYNRAWDKVGESREKEDLFGNKVIEHFDEKENKTGESR